MIKKEHKRVLMSFFLVIFCLMYFYVMNSVGYP